VRRYSASASKPLVGRPLGVLDFIKSQAGTVLDGWAEKMIREGGEHPHIWCVERASKFASDPQAFCASVHMRAYGMPPGQRREGK